MAFIERIRAAYQGLRTNPSDQPIQRRAYGSGLTGGGIVNSGTGMGTSLDKSQGAAFQPTRIWWRSPLEILCNESWVARNAIDIPIEDMLRRWLHVHQAQTKRR